MANRFWITLAGGNFPGTTANWSATSGGVGGATVPGPSDNAYIDGNSGTGIITATATTTLAALDFNNDLGAGVGTFGGTFKVNLSVNLIIGGLLSLSAAMTYTPNANCSFQANNPTTSLRSSGHALGTTTLQGVNGAAAWNLSDDCVTSNAYTCSLVTNNHNISVGQFTPSGGCVYTLGTSQLTVTGGTTFWNAAALNSISFSTGCTITFTDQGSAASYTFAGNGKTYPDVKFLNAANSNVTFTGSNTYGKLVCTPGMTLKFTAATTHTLNDFPQINGVYNGTKTTLQSTAAGTAWNFSKTTGLVVCDWLSIKDSHAAGGASFYANQSTNVSGNTGWIFAGPGETVAVTSSKNDKGKVKQRLGGDVVGIQQSGGKRAFYATRRRLVAPFLTATAIVGFASGVGSASAIGVGLFPAAGSAAGQGAGAGIGASTVAGTASASGTGSTTSIGISTVASIGAAAGVGGASATDVEFAASVGSSDGISTAQASGLELSIGAGSSPSSGQAVGIAGSIAAAEGVGAVSGTGNALVPAVGSATGTGSTSSVGASITHAAASASGTSDVQAVGIETADSIATVLGTSSSQAIAAETAASEADSSGTSSANGFGNALTRLIGFAQGFSDVEGIGAAIAHGFGLVSGFGYAEAEATATAASDGNAPGSGEGAADAIETAESIGQVEAFGLATGDGTFFWVPRPIAKFILKNVRVPNRVLSNLVGRLIALKRNFL